MGTSKVFVESASLFHGVDHVDKRVVSFFNFTTANWRKFELIVFKNVRARSVNFSTVFASKVFLSFSILDACSSYHRSKKHHILIHMALPDISD